MSKKEKTVTRYSQSVERNGICKKIKIFIDNAKDAYDLSPHSQIVFSSTAFLSEVAPSPIETEENIFELLRDIAELFPDLHAVMIIKNPDVSGGTDALEFTKAQIRALFRAAVYGNFSILCESVRTRSEYDRFSNVINKIFCELESESREFNGYIPKGILISSPLSAFCITDCAADFFCIDLDRLLPLMVDAYTLSSHIRRESLVSLSKILNSAPPNKKIKLSLFSSTLAPDVCELAEICGACEIWCKK